MAKRNSDLEAFGTTINDLDKGLPKSRGRCFDIGIWGGCGENCGAFLDGECKNPQEIIDLADEDLVLYLSNNNYYLEELKRKEGISGNERSIYSR